MMRQIEFYKLRKFQKVKPSVTGCVKVINKLNINLFMNHLMFGNELLEMCFQESLVGLFVWPLI